MLRILTLNKPNITDFAKERNDLLKKSKTDWVLFLDSDEKIAYQLKRKTYFLGKYIGIDYPTRLVKKGTGKWTRKVHEYWEPYIIHNTADNLTDYLKKINYYSGLHAKANLEEGKKSNLFKIIIFPVAKFILALLKSKHVVFSIMQSLHSYLSWTKLYFLQH